MKIKKIIDARIDIKDTSDIYCQNYNKKIIELLNKKFKEKCFGGVFILEVTKILLRSRFMGKNVSLSGDVYLDVKFEADAIVYEKNDVIHNCKIIQINNNGTIHAKSKYTSLYIKNTGGITIFKEGDSIIAIVNNIQYNPFESEILITAVPLLPMVKKSTIYLIKDQEKDLVKETSKEDGIDYSRFVSIQETHNKLKKDFPKSFKIFKELLYPFKTPRKYSFGKSYQITTENLEKISQNEYYYRPQSFLDDDLVYVLKKSDIESVKKIFPDTSIVEISRIGYIQTLINDYIKNLLKLNSFIENYKDDESIKQGIRMWTLYKLTKV